MRSASVPCGFNQPLPREVLRLQIRVATDVVANHFAHFLAARVWRDPDPGCRNYCEDNGEVSDRCRASSAIQFSGLPQRPNPLP